MRRDTYAEKSPRGQRRLCDRCEADPYPNDLLGIRSDWEGCIFKNQSRCYSLPSRLTFG